MNKEEFILKYKSELGCSSGGGVCWCKICCTLEKIWQGIHRHIAESIILLGR